MLTLRSTSTRRNQFITVFVVAIALIAHVQAAVGQVRPPRGRSLSYSFHVGSAHPLGNLDSLSDANIHVDVDWTYRFGDLTTGKHLNLRLFVD